ncbi:hypothetical protein [Mycobacterium sp. PSTR-4-N]|uniref:hypothetical protein n=1 Tax=Mycobacterium sp. PSTR-4-N TaxID=2917745 RepID=UPI001F151BA4|nr:hypothetical protein [Mycobacterium sp. PSTR-4-N]MCG7597837.1 hypothetical protein [Mycobacterium sp. PSTR-4-N]
MTATRPSPCGLNGCTNPSDPDSAIGRCGDCTLSWSVTFMRIQQAQQQRAAAATERAAVDAVLLLQSWYREDTAAGQIIAENCDVWSVLVQTFGFLFATLRHFDVDIDERLDIWLQETRAQIGEKA